VAEEAPAEETVEDVKVEDAAIAEAQTAEAEAEVAEAETPEADDASNEVLNMPAIDSGGGLVRTCAFGTIPLVRFAR